MPSLGIMQFFSLRPYENSREDLPVINGVAPDTMRPSETNRQSDAMVVKRAFASSRKVLKFLVVLLHDFFSPHMSSLILLHAHLKVTFFNYVGFCFLKFKGTILHCRGGSCFSPCGSY